MSKRAKSNGGLGKNALRNVARGPRKWSRRARIFPRTILIDVFAALDSFFKDFNFRQEDTHKIYKNNANKCVMNVYRIVNGL